MSADNQYRQGREEKTSGVWCGSLLQLIAAVVICGGLLGGNQLFPEQMTPVNRTLRRMLSAATDFETAFSVLGTDLSDGESVPDAVGEWCVSVFAPAQLTEHAFQLPEAYVEPETQLRKFLATWDGSAAAWKRQFLSARHRVDAG